jgi:hypothetical protein
MTAVSVAADDSIQGVLPAFFAPRALPAGRVFSALVRDMPALAFYY